MTDRVDIVAAFADGESVSAPDLEAALSHEDARAYLIDVLALRGLVSGARPQPATGVSAATPVRRRGPLVRLVAAAAVVIVSVGAGFVVGRGTSSPSIGSAPTPALAEQAKPAPISAPAPTHVFRIENGVTWNERAGGN